MVCSYGTKEAFPDYMDSPNTFHLIKYFLASKFMLPWDAHNNSFLEFIRAFWISEE